MLATHAAYAPNEMDLTPGEPPGVIEQRLYQSTDGRRTS